MHVARHYSFYAKPMRALPGYFSEAGPSKLKNYGKMEVFAHRGASQALPENTMAAFQAAMDFQAAGIELDIQFSKDQKVVVIHDDTLERTGCGFMPSFKEDKALLKKKIFDLSYEDISKVDVGEGQKAPLLRKVMEVALKERMPLLIEIKDSKRDIKPLLDLLFEWQKGFDPEDFAYVVRVISMDFKALEMVHEAMPLVPIYWVLEKQDFSEDNAKKAIDAGFHLDLEVCSEAVELCRTIKEFDASRKVAVWVNKETKTDGHKWALKMSKAGVDIFTSDLPVDMFV